MIHRISPMDYKRAMRVFTNQMWYPEKTVKEAEQIIDNVDAGATFSHPQRPFYPTRMKRQREPVR